MTAEAGGGVLRPNGQLRAFTPAETRRHARERQQRAAAQAWWAEIRPPLFRELPSLPSIDTLHRWLLAHAPDDPDRRRFETLLRQLALIQAELAVRYWRVGTTRRTAVLQEIRRREQDT